MQNSFTYSPPMHNGDPYRQQGSMGPVHPVNLPPLRMDGHIQHHQAYSQPQQSQMPSPPMTGYYAQAPQVMYHGQHISHMQAGPYRAYGIPITHTRSSKKEIKRRTKTGCMTCRKRRIKCDEQKPVCRNCVKSKRECQGYDPLYKNQPGAGGQQQQRNNSTVSCCAPSPTQRPPSPPASISSFTTTTASSPTTATPAGIATPSSSSSFCSTSSSALASTASFNHPTYSTAPISHHYSTTPVSHSYSAAPMTHSYSTASVPQYSSNVISQSYTLPSPSSSSRPSPLSNYYSSNTAVDSLHASAGGRSLPTMTRPMHGMTIY